MGAIAALTADGLFRGHEEGDDDFFELLAETAIRETKKTGVFVLPGLGRLKKRERKARMGRNPKTGEPMKIKAKTVVKFYVAKPVKDVISPPKK